jgi:hypothetical protein
MEEKELKKMKNEELTPDPGTDEALGMGCTCPVIDNSHGLGALGDGGPFFWIAEDCPLHDKQPREGGKDGR